MGNATNAVPADAAALARNAVDCLPEGALAEKMCIRDRSSAIEPLTRQFCERALDPLVGSGGSVAFDFIGDLGALIPMRTIGYLLGIPEQGQEAIRDKTDHAISLKDGGSSYVCLLYTSRCV